MMEEHFNSFDMKKDNKLIKKICDKYGILLYNRWSGADGDREWLNFACAYRKSKRIFLGTFKDRELRLVIFFHELWHILKKEKENETHYDYERSTTLKAMRYAELLGIRLSLMTIIKLYKYLNSHSWVGGSLKRWFNCM